MDTIDSPQPQAVTPAAIASEPDAPVWPPR